VLILLKCAVVIKLMPHSVIEWGILGIQTVDGNILMSENTRAMSG
jgi:hypothetical protein